ncbi:MAG: SUMF1/EgtB/PvdO family nonheme iron enzyme [Gemmatimonadales bacterium]|nr:SUMF1/EgtB/PvdO family nonheme iron enzyme [Gemmatimonadales bacterium]NIO31549.1 SUMF1/EgtB/PvdO family nonheme iron enzyme [Gemmatimonadota bacterium]
MVYVPAGSFAMGSGGLSWLRFTGNFLEGTLKLHPLKNESPRHSVYLGGFWIDRTEVTVAQFRRFTTATGYRTSAERDDWGKPWRAGPQDREWPRVSGISWRRPHDRETGARDEHPVVQVSWDDATAYCRWADARLPTEAEWEKAARGTDGRRFPWGNEFDPSRLNYCDSACPVERWRDPEHGDGFALTSPVGSYPEGASPHGALDMVGNVWEWVADWYDSEYYERSPEANPTGPDSGTLRAMRGGAWYDGEAEAWTTTTVRHQNPPWDRYEDVGFRCAMDATRPEDGAVQPVTAAAVPVGPAITIDGILGEHEWADAAAFMMTGGRQLLLQHSGTHLHLGVRARELGWVHVAARTESGALVWHASAALGTFEYRMTGPEWRLSGASGWSMRDTSQTESARQARAAHLQEHGWIASTAWMGTPEEREFTIAMDLFGNTVPHIAVLYATDEVSPEYSHWPTSLNDAVLNEELMMGEAPISLEFRPESWAQLRLRTSTGPRPPSPAPAGRS